METMSGPVEERIEAPAAGGPRREAPPGKVPVRRFAFAPSPEILRFLKSERVLHWCIAVPFLICFVTALILVAFYNAHPQRPYRALFSWIHRISGLLLALLPPLALFRGRSELRVHVRNIREAWVWSLDDFRWLARSGPAALSGKVSLPEQGKFNAAEKLNFMAVMGVWPLFVLTGAMIWMPGISFFSWVIHFSLAVLILPLMLGHLFMATINPSTRVGLRGMITGYVDRRWAKHHYRKWYREHFEKEEAPAWSRGIAPWVLRQPARVRCSGCKAVLTYHSWERLLERVFAARALRCPHCKAEVPVASGTVRSRTAEAILRHLEQGGAEDPLEGEDHPAA